MVTCDRYLSCQRLWALACWFLFGLLVVSCTWNAVGQSSTPESPRTADAFVDSVGLNVRLSYSEWPTATHWQKVDLTQNSRHLITDLGIRHLRDRIPHPELQSTISYVNPRLGTLYLDHGATFIVGVDARRDDGTLDPSKTAAFVDWYASGELTTEAGERVAVRDMVEAIEGPNEYDRHHQPEQREPNWADNLNAYQAQIYEAVNAEPELADIPVVAPSLIYTEYCRAPLQPFAASANLGNLHPYPNYPYMRHPTATLSWHLERVTACTGDKPIWATETGYPTEDSNPEKISERTAAKYTPRLLTEYFLTGKIARTFLHEIARDTVDGWGLVAVEAGQHLRPKPAYHAVKSLLGLLSEATWDKDQRQWGSPEVALQPVAIAFEEKQPSTHHLLLQGTQRYYLLLWQEVESYNPDRGNFEVPPDTLTAQLPREAHSLVVHTYNSAFTYDSQPLTAHHRQVQLSVPDSVMVLEFAL
ncbi:MAG: hypothetical protein AAF289_09370 [Cyanobacteria bacterium P01_A01_bin.135]